MLPFPQLISRAGALFMAQISIADTTGVHFDVQLDDNSPLAKSELRSLSSVTAQIVGEFSKPLEVAKLAATTFGANFTSPSITAGGNRTLTIKSGANASLCELRASDSPLFGDDPYAPPIVIGDGQCWIAFELDTLFDLTLNLPVGIGGVSGFGVGIEASVAPTFTSYTLFDKASGALPTLGQAVGMSLSNFDAVTSAAQLRNQKPGTVQASDIIGTVTLSGSYSLPISVNQLSLADAKLPFNYSVNVRPQLGVTLAGSIAITGEYIVRSFRKTGTELQLGVYKKRGTDLSASFTAGAGVHAPVGKTDLIASFFSAVVPGVDLKAAGLSDADLKTIQKTLKDSIDRSLSLSLNLCCSACFDNEAALVYSIDLTGDQATTDAAIDAAFRGDWTLLANLPNAKSLRNVVGETQQNRHKTVINLLGIYNYESVATFIGSCTVLRSPEDGTITITDNASASRISVASMPYAADADRLRTVLAQAFLATATYTAANSGGKLSADLNASLSYLLYEEELHAQSVRKDLLVGIALGLISQAEWQNLAPASACPKHVRIAAKAVFGNDAAMRLFFSDPTARTPWALDHLKRVGRNVLSSLLDPNDPIDARRQQVLGDDTTWSQMDQQRFPADSPASYGDWYDITFWAKPISQIAPLINALLQAVDQSTAADPSTDPNFMAKRDALAKGLGQVSRNTHAAHEADWPIAVMCQLSGFRPKVSLQAAWDGKLYFNKP
ncbi:MAG: hypothetical protein ACRD3T_09090 [Terriglobia bacterium]